MPIVLCARVFGVLCLVGGAVSAVCALFSGPRLRFDVAAHGGRSLCLFFRKCTQRLRVEVVDSFPA